MTSADSADGSTVKMPFVVEGRVGFTVNATALGKASLRATYGH
ncbi:hypothetical protein [Pseudooceanicola marinus]|nr:hypothetical protein [Pseudooceanicola marinus]